MVRGILIVIWFLVLPTYAARQYKIEHLLRGGIIRGVSFSPDESEILVSIDSGTGFRMHSISIKDAEGREIRTRSGSPATAVSYFPKDKRILFTQRSSDRRQQLCVRELNGAETDLAPDAEVAEFQGWSADKRSLFVWSSFPASVRQIDTSSYKSNVMHRGDLFVPAGYIAAGRYMSPDGQWIASELATSPTVCDLSLFNVRLKESQNIAFRSHLAQYRFGCFDPDSRWFYYLTNVREDFLRVRRYELATGEMEDVERTDCNIIGTFFSPKGRYRASIIDRDGCSELVVYETTTRKRIDLPTIPRGNMMSVTFSPSERLLAFHLETDRSPPNLYVCDLSKSIIKKLTDLRSRRMNEEDLVESQPVHFKSFDGLSIPCLLYKPKQATAKRKAPGILWLHGGPFLQTRVGYSPPLQYFVNHGFVVLAVNYRGSTGYGASFAAADDKKHGYEPVMDCLEAKKYLASLPYVDSERIGALGESYGGYLVLAVLAFHPDVFKVGVDLFGVSNWTRTIAAIESESLLAPKALLLEFGDPHRERENLQAISPLSQADKIRRPLFIVQGAKDKKIPKEDTDAVVSIVKQNGTPLEYLVLEHEGHGVASGIDYLQVWRRILQFLERNL